MKKVISLVLGLVLLFALSGCGSEEKESQTDSSSVNMEELKESYPEYFELSDFKGIEVYVWQMAENSYRCGLLGGTNREKTQEEIWNLEFKSLSIEQAKAILDELGTDKDDIVVIPVTQPFSSYAYEIDDEYRQKVTALFK